MGVNLTQGTIARIFSNDSVYSNDREINPVLQIIEVEKRCVWLSDGTNSDIGLLAGNLFDSVAYLEKLQKGSIVKLSVYTLSQSLNRVIFIFDCDVVLNKCDIIGEPVPLPKNAHSHLNGSDILLKYHTLQPQPQPNFAGYFNILGLSDLGFSDIGIGLSELTLYDKTKGALETMCSHNSSDFMPVLVLQAMEFFMDCFRGYVCLSDGKSAIYALIPIDFVDESCYYQVDIISSGFKDKLLVAPLLNSLTICLRNFMASSLLSSLSLMLF